MVAMATSATRSHTGSTPADPREEAKGRYCEPYREAHDPCFDDCDDVVCAARSETSCLHATHTCESSQPLSPMLPSIFTMQVVRQQLYLLAANASEVPPFGRPAARANARSSRSMSWPAG
jgi:hypothetical protein